MAIELADLERGAHAAVFLRQPAQRDVLLQNRRPSAAGDDPHLTATNVDAVSVTGSLVTLDLDSDQQPLRVRLALDEGGAPHEIVIRAVEVDGETDTGLERVDLVVILITRENQP